MQRALTILALSLLAAPAAGHIGSHEPGTMLSPEVAWEHTAPIESALPAGRTANMTLAFEGQALTADWVMLFSGNVSGAPLSFELSANETVVHDWQWEPGMVHLETVTLPTSAIYHLTIHNPTESDAYFSFHFDQTCDCTAKASRLPNGALWFNWVPQTDVQIEFRFEHNLDPGIIATDAAQPAQVRVTYALRTGAAGHWPDDFDLRGTEIFMVGSEGTTLGIELPASDERQYFLIETAGVTAPWRMDVLPTITEVKADDDAGLPVLEIAAVLALLAAFAWVARGRLA